MRRSPVCPAAGGWNFPANPAASALTAAPLWRPQLYPATVIVTGAPKGFGAPPLSDPIASSFSGSAANGLHAIIADDHGDHGIWLPKGEQPASTAFLIPHDAHFLWRVRSALRLHRLLGSRPSGRWPREQRLTRFQLHRASLMLRAWDGVESGATRRHVASVILNPDVAFMRALDWKNAPERRRLARILKAARETIDGGYLSWLAPRSRRRESLRKRPS